MEFQLWDHCLPNGIVFLWKLMIYNKWISGFSDGLEPGIQAFNVYFQPLDLANKRISVEMKTRIQVFDVFRLCIWPTIGFMKPPERIGDGNSGFRCSLLLHFANKWISAAFWGGLALKYRFCDISSLCTQSQWISEAFWKDWRRRFRSMFPFQSLHLVNKWIFEDFWEDWRREFRFLMLPASVSGQQMDLIGFLKL